MARCLRPGGYLIADVALRGQLRRTDAFMTFARTAKKVFGPPVTLTEAQLVHRRRLTINTQRQAGALVYIDAQH